MAKSLTSVRFTVKLHTLDAKPCRTVRLRQGLNMFTKSLGVEVIKHGINVNCIAPGLVFTKLANRYSKEDLESFSRKIPFGNGGMAEDITPLILFLADDSKSRFIVGQTFVVDGGQSIDGAIESMEWRDSI